MKFIYQTKPFQPLHQSTSQVTNIMNSSNAKKSNLNMSDEIDDNANMWKKHIALLLKANYDLYCEVTISRNRTLDNYGFYDTSRKRHCELASIQKSELLCLMKEAMEENHSGKKYFISTAYTNVQMIVLTIIQE